MSYFYSHLIEIESLTVKLEELDLTTEQRLHLALLVDSTIHHEILDLILSKLGDQDRKIFLERLKLDAGDEKMIEFLNSRMENIEDQIRNTAKKLKEDLHEDIKTAQGGK